MMEKESSKSSRDYDPFQVALPVFDGPLDLLLQLVRKQALDISELRLAELTEPYLAHLETIKELNLDQAGEFLSIASTLIWIKSKTLLPRTYDEDEINPENEEDLLLLRLREYQKIKEAAFELGSLDMLGREVFARRPPPEEPERNKEEAPFEEVSLFTLIEAFRTVLEDARRDKELHIIPERENLEDKLSQVLARLAEKKSVFFKDLLSSMANRGEFILVFLAVLELARMKAIRLFQTAPGGEIHCVVTEIFGSGEVDWSAMILGGILGPSESGAPPGTPEN